jgi:hypothetical protein
MCMKLIRPIEVYNEAQRLKFYGKNDEYKAYLIKYNKLIRNDYTIN